MNVCFSLQTKLRLRVNHAGFDMALYRVMKGAQWLGARINPPSDDLSQLKVRFAEWSEECTCVTSIEFLTADDHRQCSGEAADGDGSRQHDGQAPARLHLQPGEGVALPWHRVEAGLDGLASQHRHDAAEGIVEPRAASLLSPGHRVRASGGGAVQRGVRVRVVRVQRSATGADEAFWRGDFAAFDIFYEDV